jgi:hypothetical protein
MQQSEIFAKSASTRRLTTPATVIPCKKCKRRPGYPIDARRRWRGWRRTARIRGGSSSGPALSRPPIRARPAQPEARAVFRWRHGALGGVVAKCKGDNPEHHQDGSGYYHQMRKFHSAPHSFFFQPKLHKPANGSCQRRMVVLFSRPILDLGPVSLHAFARRPLASCRSPDGLAPF